MGRRRRDLGGDASPATRAGYYELSEDDDGVEVAYFGLLPAFHGHGLGGFLLTHALRRGFELAPRVWLHTCTLDGPAALPNYRARGPAPVPDADALRAGPRTAPPLERRAPLHPHAVARGAAARHGAGGADRDRGEQAALERGRRSASRRSTRRRATRAAVVRAGAA